MTLPDHTITPRFALRNATSQSHEAVDSVFSGFDLTQSAGYRSFLRAQAAAFVPVEAALDAGDVAHLIPDWSERRRAPLLLADLADLGDEDRDFVDAPAIDGPAATLGAAYVLEGSRMGGQMLRRSLPADLPARFLSAPMQSGSWRRLTELLDEALDQPADIAVAVASARAVFACFEAAGRRERERG